MTAKIIFFDFDGTIADTRDTFIEIVNQLSGEFGYKPVAEEDIERFQNLSSKEIIKQSQISLIQIPFLLRRVKIELNKKISTLEPFIGLSACLHQLQKKGYTLGIITSNLEKNVITFLQNNELDHLFKLIYCDTSLFGKDKVINQIIRTNRFKRENLIYVGDETRDITAARKSNIKMIAVGWGFNSPKILAKYEPDVLIHHPQELLQAVEKLNGQIFEKSPEVHQTFRLSLSQKENYHF
ncbi:HAD hydrolase-like protein [Chroococcus sp. FPU101]|uniref:HAD hydrolase-like protein n=1 Tax=Chroococcus sp. FPU101 TaxID=1974212 RepID=UPI001A8E7D1E|nr:HAD hydrolase-like protein [Chroococcus sp. FPU101]GFE71623.1 HAD-superfamily hydrolase, subfamily IA, variant 1 [Chroococcus sp. FPU101]